MGVLTGIAAAIGGAKTLWDWFSGSDEDKSETQFDRNAWLQRDAQAWQSIENEKAWNRNIMTMRESADLQRQMFGLQNAEYDRRLADERAYNDPSAQVARAARIGINPSAALGMGVGSDQTFAPPSDAVAPSAGSAPATGASGSSVGLMNTDAQMLGGAASMFKSLLSGLKDDTERKRMEKLMGFEIKDAMLGNQLKEIDKFIAEKTKDTKISEEFWKLANLKVDHLLKGSLNAESVQRELNLIEDRFWTMSKRRLNDQEFLQAKLLYDNFDRILDARLDAMRAESFKNFKEGQLFVSQKQIQDDLHILNLPETETAKKLFEDKEQLAVKYQNLARDMRNAGQLSDKEFELITVELDNAKNINQFPWWLKSMKKTAEWFGDRLQQVPVTGVKMFK